MILRDIDPNEVRFTIHAVRKRNDKCMHFEKTEFKIQFSSSDKLVHSNSDDRDGEHIGNLSLISCVVSVEIEFSVHLYFVLFANLCDNE